MELPDLRNPDPERTSRTPETTVFYDFIPAMKNIGEALSDIEQTGEAAAIAGAIQYIDNLIEIAGDFRRNLKVVQYELNRPSRDYAKMSRQERKALRDAIRDGAIREKWLEMRKRYDEERERKRQIAREKKEERRAINRQEHYRLQREMWRARRQNGSSMSAGT